MAYKCFVKLFTDLHVYVWLEGYVDYSGHCFTKPEVRGFDFRCCHWHLSLT